MTDCSILTCLKTLKSVKVSFNSFRKNMKVLELEFVQKSSNVGALTILNIRVIEKWIFFHNSELYKEYHKI